MKAYTLFLLCVVVATVKCSKTDEALESLRLLSASCMEDLGLSKAVFDEMIKNEPATSMDVKCLRACIMKAVSVVTPDGKFHKDNALQIAKMHVEGDEEKMKIARAIVDACEAVPVPDDHCEAAEVIKMCILAEAKKHGVNGLL